MERIYLVSGASGHLGTTICRELCLRGEKVRALVMPGDPAPGLEGLPLERREGNLTDKESLRHFFEKPSGAELYLFHLAGLISIKDKPDAMLRAVNVEGTRHMLELSREYGVRRFLYTSTVHALPVLPGQELMEEIRQFDADLLRGGYAKTKAEATRLVLEAGQEGLDVVIIHPSGIIGPGDYGHGHLTELVLRYVNRRLPVMVNGGYNFVDVRDVADGAIAAMLKGRSGECYILSGEWHSIYELVNTMASILKRRKRRVIAPNWALRLFVSFASLFARLKKKTPLFTAYSIYTVNSNANYSHEKASHELGYHSRPFMETLKDTIRFLNRGHRFRRALPKAIKGLQLMG